MKLKNKIYLVLGGARSGKSEFAEQLAALFRDGRKGYIATAQVLDEEMRYRVILHQKRRSNKWQTFEIFHEAGSEIKKALASSDVILFDCITMYVSNLLMDHLAQRDDDTLGVADLTHLQKVVQNDLSRMFQSISEVSGKKIIFVSDELGMGIVPANPTSRIYRDLVGLANQFVAARADKVYLSVAGITIELKSRGVELHGKNCEKNHVSGNEF